MSQVIDEKNVEYRATLHFDTFCIQKLRIRCGRARCLENVAKIK